MSTRTRTWSKAIPVDHTEIKYGPTKVRDVREDIENRVDDILAGFVNTGATNGIILGRLLTVGTATSTSPGTGIAAAIDLIGLTTGTLTELVIRNASSHEILVTYQGRLQVGKLANDQYMIAVGTGSGDVNIFKVNTAGQTEFATFPIAPNTNPTTNLQLIPYGALRNMFDTSVFTVPTASAAITVDIKDSSISAAHMNTGASWRADVTQVFNDTSPTSFTDLDLSAVTGANSALVILKVASANNMGDVSFRPNGDASNYYIDAAVNAGWGANTCNVNNSASIIVCVTDASGIVEWRCSNGVAATVNFLGYIK